MFKISTSSRSHLLLSRSLLSKRYNHVIYILYQYNRKSMVKFKLIHNIKSHFTISNLESNSDILNADVEDDSDPLTLSSIRKASIKKFFELIETCHHKTVGINDNGSLVNVDQEYQKILLTTVLPKLMKLYKSGHPAIFAMISHNHVVNTDLVLSIVLSCIDVSHDNDRLDNLKSAVQLLNDIILRLMKVHSLSQTRDPILNNQDTVALKINQIVSFLQREQVVENYTNQELLEISTSIIILLKQLKIISMNSFVDNDTIDTHLIESYIQELCDHGHFTNATDLFLLFASSIKSTEIQTIMILKLIKDKEFFILTEFLYAILLPISKQLNSREFENINRFLTSLINEVYDVRGFRKIEELAILFQVNESVIELLRFHRLDKQLLKRGWEICVAFHCKKRKDLEYTKQFLLKKGLYFEASEMCKQVHLSCEISPINLADQEKRETIKYLQFPHEIIDCVIVNSLSSIEAISEYLKLPLSTHDIDIPFNNENKVTMAIGIDCEWYFQSNHDVDIIQIATPKRIFLVDLYAIIKKKSHEPLLLIHIELLLRKLFRSSEILKIGFSLNDDIKMLMSTCKGYFSKLNDNISNIVDLKGLQTSKPTNSLSSICHEYFGKELNKSARSSNWRKRPLTLRQIKYAALDSHVLLALYAFSKKLKKTSIDEDINARTLNSPLQQSDLIQENESKQQYDSEEDNDNDDNKYINQFDIDFHANIKMCSDELNIQLDDVLKMYEIQK